MDQSYMKEKPILPLLLSLAIPMILSMLVNSLYNIVDSIFVAKISEDAMAALFLVYPVQNMIGSIAVGFGVGINAAIALSFGAGEQERANAAATQGMLLGALHGILLTVLGIFFMPAFLKLFTSEPAIIDFGLRYSTIVLGFSTVITLGITFEKIFQSIGKMIITMVSMSAGCIVHIILAPIMIFGLGPCPPMGIEGAAWATGIGQAVTLLIYLAAYFIQPIPVKLSAKHIRPAKNICLQLYSIGIPATLNLALPSALISILNGLLISYSQASVLALGIYYKLQTFLYLPANGVIQGMRPLLSYNYGAGEHKRAAKIYRYSLGTICLIMLIGTSLCLGLPRVLIGMFTDNPATIDAGIIALRIISIGFIVSSLSVTSSGALEALGKGTHSFIISFLRYIIILVPAAYLMSRLIGVSGVWHAFWISELITAVIAYMIYKKGFL